MYNCAIGYRSCSRVVAAWTGGKQLLGYLDGSRREIALSAKVDQLPIKAVDAGVKGFTQFGRTIGNRLENPPQIGRRVFDYLQYLCGRGLLGQSLVQLCASGLERGQLVKLLPMLGRAFAVAPTDFWAFLTRMWPASFFQESFKTWVEHP